MTPTQPTGLDDLIAEFILAAERGQAPDPADWLARHPDHAAELVAFLADFGRFETFLGFPLLPNADLTTDFREPTASSAVGHSGESFGGYELLGEIGHGGMGTVYRARLTGTTLVVALKQIRPGGLDGAEAVKRFRQEIETVAGLRHPNVVPVYHVGDHEGQPFYTMALVEGGSLDRHLDRFMQDPRAAARLVAKTARAVHYAHQRLVLHRDLKPGNVLLDEVGEPHVADFGLAARLDESGLTTGSEPPAGSLPWMAPEAVRGDTVLTTTVDVWALGVILYELLTGTRPFRGANGRAVREAILELSPASPRSVNPRIPRDLDAICRRCLEKDPERRYESALAVAMELERWQRDEPVRARPAGRGERFARWCRRNPALAGGTVFIGALLVAVSTALVWIARDLEDQVVNIVCKNCEYEADIVADNILRRFEELGEEVSRSADNLAADPAFTSQKPESALPALKALMNNRVLGFRSVFLLDSKGILREAWPEEGPIKNVDFSGRDYFTGAHPHAAQTGRDRVHVSREFRSENQKLDKIALSVSFRPPGADSNWVLVATVTTDQNLGVVRLQDDLHCVVLVAPRDTNPPRAGDLPGLKEEYVILVHPALSPGAPTARFGTDQQPGSPPAGDQLELRSRTGTARRPFERNKDYRDPFTAGRWLTGSAAVGTTELAVVVQQRYQDAMAPHQWFMNQFLAWVGGAVAIGLVSFAFLQVLRARRVATEVHTAA